MSKPPSPPLQPPSSPSPPSPLPPNPQTDLDLINFDSSSFTELTASGDLSTLPWDVDEMESVYMEEEGGGGGGGGGKRKRGQSTTTSKIHSKVSKQVASKGKGKHKKTESKRQVGQGGKKKQKKIIEEEDPLDDEKREERNLREKERSFKISAQISMLRDLLSSGGVAVPKGTKSSVLTEAANYIRVLQQHRFNSEIDRQNLVQEIRRMNSGQMGVKAQVAVRQAVSVNMGLPPTPPPPPPPPHPTPTPPGMTPNDYNAVFQYSLIPMAIATMGGSFLECNRSFATLSGFPREVLSTMTVFNITSPSSLQSAFNSISKMIPTNSKTPPKHSSSTLEGALRNGPCLLNCSLVLSDEGLAKYFCVQLTPTPEERSNLLKSAAKNTKNNGNESFRNTAG
ncbi:hypothetical protein TrVE_jg10716 [Triparma verrucosa]|uniref:BHLH domain-containing protein n=1 Tax=Triparma verrucosa TaxID=1606542 RepID=A0A9W7C281_9STRA|nr:hypothetical protein TrVE_jg10716 [Triparma verrucosa]